MSTTFSVRRWIVLASLCAVVLVSASEAADFVSIPCCAKVQKKFKGSLRQCFEQNPRKGCRTHAYLIQDSNGNWKCIDPQHKWITQSIEMGNLSCPPVTGIH